MVKPGLNLTLVGPEGGKSGDNTAEFTNITAEKNVYYTLYDTYIVHILYNRAFLCLYIIFGSLKDDRITKLLLTKRNMYVYAPFSLNFSKFA